MRPRKKLRSLQSLMCDVPMQPEASSSDSEDGDDSIPMQSSSDFDKSSYVSESDE